MEIKRSSIVISRTTDAKNVNGTLTRTTRKWIGAEWRRWRITRIVGRTRRGPVHPRATIHSRSTKIKLGTDQLTTIIIGDIITILPRMRGRGTRTAIDRRIIDITLIGTYRWRSCSLAWLLIARLMGEDKQIFRNCIRSRESGILIDLRAIGSLLLNVYHFLARNRRWLFERTWTELQ